MNAHLSKIVGEGLTYDDVLLIPCMDKSDDGARLPKV